jgi:hypothetical protein
MLHPTQAFGLVSGHITTWEPKLDFDISLHSICYSTVYAHRSRTNLLLAHASAVLLGHGTQKQSRKSSTHIGDFTWTSGFVDFDRWNGRITGRVDVCLVHYESYAYCS